MYVKVILLILVSRFPYESSSQGVCIPNSLSLLNGKVCNCNSTGQWSERDCNPIGRRLTCTPGLVVFQGCSRCVCQESGQLICTEDSSCKGPGNSQNIYDTINAVLPWCYPFTTYYINCYICVCPASGITPEIKCARDVSCSLHKEPSTSDIIAKKYTCLPKVMYLFPCLHCLCSVHGYFVLGKCTETCAKKEIESSRRCIPKALYRKDCNVCVCPDDSVPDNNHCTNNTCNATITSSSMNSLKNKQTTCTPHEFARSRCIYCDCNHDGVVDEKSCLELPCLKSEVVKYDIIRNTCSPGEMVPFCMDCFCPRSKVTSEVFCTKVCSDRSKLKVLEKIVNLSKSKYVIDKTVIKLNSSSEACKPNSVYFEQGRYCLCPENGICNIDLCTIPESSIAWKNNETKHVVIDFNVTCEPSTYVEFDCNICFCSKIGRIDPKWCTYDDCEAKRIIQEMHSSDRVPPAVEPPLGSYCSPGSISNVDCNFCICPDNGLLEDRVCTKNECSLFFKTLSNNEKFTCDPLTYYEVDCNLCYCPREGLKNVAKCTKNHCDKSFLRSDVCLSGQLFSDECNVCVCPPNGNKAEKACTNYTCNDPWKKIFQLSESLLGNQIAEDATRNLDHCFPGEEFVSRCKICICPDTGLRIYAICSPTFCGDERHAEIVDHGLVGSNRNGEMLRKLDTRRDDCQTVKYNNGLSRQQCTAGSMYIIKCRECICPYMGDISAFCRPLPKDFHCEQAYPGVNYVVMGRRITENDTEVTLPNVVQHEHTRYECDKVGEISDDCFKCECDGEVLIVEHCFQSNATQCVDAAPTFLNDYVKYQSNKTENPL